MLSPKLRLKSIVCFNLVFHGWERPLTQSTETHVTDCRFSITNLSKLRSPNIYPALKKNIDPAHFTVNCTDTDLISLLPQKEQVNNGWKIILKLKQYGPFHYPVQILQFPVGGRFDATTQNK